MKRAGVAVAVGRYDEARGIYLSGAFASGGRATDERRTVHLGIDLFVEPGASVRAPLPGLVHVLANNTAPQDYGPLVILRHETGDAAPFYTLYGHLSRGHARRPRGRPARGGGRGHRPGGRAARERGLAAAPALPGDPRPSGPGRRLPRRRPRQPAVDLDEPLARPERAPPHPRGALPARGARPRGDEGRAPPPPRPQPLPVLPAPAQDRPRLRRSTSTTSRDARTSTPTTTCRSSATRTRGWCGRRRSSSLSSTPTRATCTTRSCATPSG